MPTIEQAFRVQFSEAGVRLDQLLSRRWPAYSRSRLQAWCKEGNIRVDGKPARPSQKLKGGEEVTLRAELAEEGPVQAQDIPLDILYQDEHILVVNKPAGLVVHPAAGNPDGTLMNALLHYDPGLNAVPRAGIVHRLDKDTSGLLVVARTLPAHKSLVEQLHDRTVHREYYCVVYGQVVAGATIDLPMGRDPADRTRMAVVSEGKEAITHYRVEDRWRHFTGLAVQLETGRTHQIRVHLSWIDHPLLGDPVYGGRPRPPRGSSDRLRQALQQFRRQALHARKLSLVHPGSLEEVSYQAPITDDLLQLRAVLTEEDGLA